jgi:hypothetical protein
MHCILQHTHKKMRGACQFLDNAITQFHACGGNINIH